MRGHPPVKSSVKFYSSGLMNFEDQVRRFATFSESLSVCSVKDVESVVKAGKIH